jgi:predicted DNA-binding transcriptional regulator YafY
MQNEYTRNFNKLQDAILDNRSVKISYTNRMNLPSIRTIKPIRFEMVERRKSFYDRLCVKAFCNLRNEERSFAIYRIKKIINFE